MNRYWLPFCLALKQFYRVCVNCINYSQNRHLHTNMNSPYDVISTAIHVNVLFYQDIHYTTCTIRNYVFINDNKTTNQHKIIIVLLLLCTPIHELVPDDFFTLYTRCIHVITSLVYMVYFVIKGDNSVQGWRLSTWYLIWW